MSTTEEVMPEKRLIDLEAALNAVGSCIAGDYGAPMCQPMRPRCPACVMASALRALPNPRPAVCKCMGVEICAGCGEPVDKPDPEGHAGDGGMTCRTNFNCWPALTEGCDVGGDRTAPCPDCDNGVVLT